MSDKIFDSITGEVFTNLQECADKKGFTYRQHCNLEKAIEKKRLHFKLAGLECGVLLTERKEASEDMPVWMNLYTLENAQRRFVDIILERTGKIPLAERVEQKRPRTRKPYIKKDLEL